MGIPFSSVVVPKQIRVVFVVALTIIVVYAIVSVVQSRYMVSPNAQVEEDIRVTTEAVGKLMDLPAEKPTVATVRDVTKLSGQAFFAPAKNGDKVLFFNTAKKVILYRPETNKIINIAPISIQPKL